MALKMELLDASLNPTGSFVSTGDMTNPISTTHYLNLGDGSNQKDIFVRLVNDTPSTYEYRNVTLTAYDTVAGGMSASYFTFSLDGATWSISLNVGTVGATPSNPIRIRINVPDNSGLNGTYTDIKIRVNYDQVDLNQLP